MFDYNLVSTRAVYRICLPRDIPDLLRLALQRCQEQQADPALARESIRLTLEELSRHKGRGSILLIDVEEEPVGYCILSNRWSHRHGGNMLCVDELYVAPGHEGLGLAQDLFDLLAEVAPAGSVAIQAELPGPGRRTASAWERMGFHQDGNPVMIRQTRRNAP